MNYYWSDVFTDENSIYFHDHGRKEENVVTANIPTITASVPSLIPPVWSILQRKLFEVLSASVHPFLEKYTHQGGERQHELIWGGQLKSRDGADDFYESFYNFPLLYLLGGADDLLPLGLQQWNAITRQLTRFGHVHKEYERGYDQFHQSESYIYFYLLCLADPTNPELIERARRFAGFYLNEDPEALNYDAAKNILRAPHTGSGGPRWGVTDDGEPASYGWSQGMSVYGLPFQNVAGIDRVEDLRDPANARRMGQAMERGYSRGDVGANLNVSTLVANAALLTGDEKYRRWILHYVQGWRERAQCNGGLIPDNVGLSGMVGEYVDGKWYGGLYGWNWPHGFYNLQAAALCAAQSCLLLTNDLSHLDLPRGQQNYILALGEMRSFAEVANLMSLRHHWLNVEMALDKAEEGDRTFVVPYRYGDSGWFDYQPMSPVYPAALWALTGAASDWVAIVGVRDKSSYDWRPVFAFKTKEDSGHEQPWIEYLAGRNPDYPESVMRSALGVTNWHLDQIRADTSDFMRLSIHHWQEHNPITTEALIQLTLGAPQIIYNGGLLVAPLRHFDAERNRPGLPPDIAALVTQVSTEQVTIIFVNTSAFEARTLIVQSGSFGEHAFESVEYTRCASGSRYPGAEPRYEYGETLYSPPDPKIETVTQALGGKYLKVHLPPATEITLVLRIQRYVNQASYAIP